MMRLPFDTCVERTWCSIGETSTDSRVYWYVWNDLVRHTLMIVCFGAGAEIAAAPILVQLTERNDCSKQTPLMMMEMTMIIMLMTTIIILTMMIMIIVMILMMRDDHDDDDVEPHLCIGSAVPHAVHVLHPEAALHEVRQHRLRQVLPAPVRLVSGSGVTKNNITT
jgi:hypothetical protein